eukprot:gnl/TRDRNA2_/TRDRNA2_174300_c0_seq7.p1 gnl/TRDRNA2_/TRDRNA2_174300_c0~~gnl/TRDRNA2_/TRDRNA2_174300_c0_seq7.p1  ORF type:complete len:155 (-),score=13.06 gnl/TRDRNA2_/TRDRNA2_174300_c0_seq7:194-658(-)
MLYLGSGFYHSTGTQRTQFCAVDDAGEVFIKPCEWLDKFFYWETTITGKIKNVETGKCITRAHPTSIVTADCSDDNKGAGTLMPHTLKNKMAVTTGAGDFAVVFMDVVDDKLRGRMEVMAEFSNNVKRHDGVDMNDRVHGWIYPGTAGTVWHFS